MCDTAYAYTLLLRRPPDTFVGARYEFYEYTTDDPPFVRRHTTQSIHTMLEFIRAYVRDDVRFEIENNPFFWENTPPEILRIADPDLRAFIHYALHGIMAPLYTLSEAYYLANLLDTSPDARLVIGWEAQPPLHDVAYGIVEIPEEG